jgi:acetolactate synthase-1/2/3 large subunit
MDEKQGGQLVAESLLEKGVRCVFTLSGGHITPIYQYLENSPITLVDTRHEQAAVFMAEAMGRMTRQPAVALVTAGPGFTNSLSAIANASFSNAPLLLISGSVGVESIGKLDLQDMRQAPVIEPMVKKAFVCHRTERIPEFVDAAYRTAISGRPGPVYLELPVDILNAFVSDEKVKRTHTVPRCRPLDLEKPREALEMIESARQPIVIAGSGAWYSGAERNLGEFIEKTGIPVFTSSMGRGCVPDTHPLCFESSLSIRPGAALYANMSADLVMILGSRVTLFYIFGEIFSRKARIIHVDIEPEEIGRNRTVDLPVFSDVREFLRVCNRLVDENGLGETLRERFQGWVNALREAHKDGKSTTIPNWESDRVPIHPLRLAREVDAFMNREDDIVCADGGDTQVWMGMTRTVRRPGLYLDSGLFGCLGVGIPYANAAKLLHPDKRVCLIIGDGSVGFNFMEFETSIRKGIPIVAVVSNDLGWGMIRHSQELRLGHAIQNGTFIGKVDYHRLVEALGGKGMFVERPEDIRPALEAAFDSGRTTCINVMTDPTTVSPGSVALANLGAYKA